MKKLLSDIRNNPTCLYAVPVIIFQLLVSALIIHVSFMPLYYLSGSLLFAHVIAISLLIVSFYISWKIFKQFLNYSKNLNKVR